MLSEWHIALIVYAVLNVIAFIMFAWDKYKAKEGMWRTKESTLILISLFGPVGATIGMQMVRHKTQKLKFKLVYVFLAIHIALIGYMAYMGYIPF